MQAFDASSMIYAWDNYPIRQFPPLWEWVALQIKDREIVMSRIAFDEVKHKTPDCGNWLKENDIELLEVDNEIIQESIVIKGLLGIDNDDYHPKGVGENDLFIIATAKLYGADLVSEENVQTQLPDVPKKMKIPAVCDLPEVSVECINFVKCIKNSNEIFG